MQDLLAVRTMGSEKISHDYMGKDINLFSYRDLVGRGISDIGIPAKQNGLLIIDVDVGGDAHKHDGRPWWNEFVKENGLTPTYTVQTRSGGYHFYYRLPEAINPETFQPPKELAKGVDVKWNGWVSAPPSLGYMPIYGTIMDIVDVPPTLLAEISRQVKGKMHREFEFNGTLPDVHFHQPFSPEQLEDLKKRIEWIQINGNLDREEWLKGLFALKAGISDYATLQEFAHAWTYNQAYRPGDEIQAMQILEKASPVGAVGPGTIYSIIQGIAGRAGAVSVAMSSTLGDILAKAQVIARPHRTTGVLTVEPSETNAAAILGAMYDENDLYHDIRQDLYYFQGDVYSDNDLVNTLLPSIQSTSNGLGLEKFKRATVAAGLDVLMARRRFDPHQRWLNQLTWDGVPRIDKFFVKYLHVEDSHYHRECGRIFWLSLAARGLWPGCKHDSMVIIEGKEGLRKSSIIEAIGGEYSFAPTNDKAFSDLDELRKMHQAIIVELPELIGIIGQDSKKVKGFMAKAFDHIRDLFAKKAKKRLRGFIFVGTTNEKRYLHSQMGVRRFMPVVIPDSAPQVDVELIRTNREQLFAEAVARAKRKEDFHTLPIDDMTEIVGARTNEDPLLQSIREMWGMIAYRDVTVTEAYRALEIAGYVRGGLTHAVAKRIEDSFYKLGFRPHRVNSVTVWKKELQADSFF